MLSGAEANAGLDEMWRLATSTPFTYSRSSAPS